MQSEYCPICRTITTVMETVVPKVITDNDGDTKVVIVKTYHCESCRSFVRSTEEEPAIV